MEKWESKQLFPFHKGIAFLFLSCYCIEKLSIEIFMVDKIIMKIKRKPSECGNYILQIFHVKKDL